MVGVHMGRGGTGEVTWSENRAAPAGDSALLSLLKSLVRILTNTQLPPLTQAFSPLLFQTFLNPGRLRRTTMASWPTHGASVSVEPWKGA